MAPLPTVNARARVESVTSNLENSHMVREEIQAKRERTFTGTIWDTPEEREIMQNGNGVVVNENGTKDDCVL